MIMIRRLSISMGYGFDLIVKTPLIFFFPPVIHSQRFLLRGMRIHRMSQMSRAPESSGLRTWKFMISKWRKKIRRGEIDIRIPRLATRLTEKCTLI